MHMHYFQHVSFEQPGSITEWCQARGHLLTGTQFYKNELHSPDFDTIDLLVIMGGPMNIYEEEEYPWLNMEKQWIKQAIALKKPILGICLGAQLLADSLGAKVYPGKEKEIGWFPITRTSKYEPPFQYIPKQMNVFHWHGDTFNLPENAVRMASSKVCQNQAFIYEKNMIGLQFHLEVGEENIRDIIDHSRNELTQGRYIQAVPDMCGRFGLIQQNKAILFQFMDQWMNSLIIK